MFCPFFQIPTHNPYYMMEMQVLANHFLVVHSSILLASIRRFDLAYTLKPFFLVISITIVISYFHLQIQQSVLDWLFNPQKDDDGFHKVREKSHKIQ